MNQKIYILTDDTQNKKYIFLLSFVQNYTKREIIFLSTIGTKENTFGYKQEYVNNKKYYKLLILWSKFCFLLSRNRSNIDKNFPRRNYYSFNIYKNFINIFWKIKNLKYLKYLFPEYDKLLFLLVPKSNEFIFSNDSIFLFDSMLTRNLKFLSLIKTASSKYNNYCFVASFDNPFYTQIYTSATKYFIWSKQMLNDLIYYQNIKSLKSKCVEIGPFPFYEFYKSKNIKFQNDTLLGNIGYACAYPDPFLACCEIDFIIYLSKMLKSINKKLIVKTYPSLNIDFYYKLKTISNVVIYQNKNSKLIDRYGDGRELISFTSIEDRRDFIEYCDLFISLATSFTIEVAIDGLKFLQFYIPIESRVNEFEKYLFDRIDISDHLLKYYINNNPNIIYSYKDLFQFLNSYYLKNNKIKFDNSDFLKQFNLNFYDI